jgi:hypothetical protein
VIGRAQAPIRARARCRDRPSNSPGLALRALPVPAVTGSLRWAERHTNSRTHPPQPVQRTAPAPSGTGLQAHTAGGPLGRPARQRVATTRYARYPLKAKRAGARTSDAKRLAYLALWLGSCARRSHRSAPAIERGRSRAQCAAGALPPERWPLGHCGARRTTATDRGTQERFALTRPPRECRCRCPCRSADRQPSGRYGRPRRGVQHRGAGDHGQVPSQR